MVKLYNNGYSAFCGSPILLVVSSEDVVIVPSHGATLILNAGDLACVRLWANSQSQPEERTTNIKFLRCRDIDWIVTGQDWSGRPTATGRLPVWAIRSWQQHQRMLDLPAWPLCSTADKKFMLHYQCSSERHTIVPRGYTWYPLFTTSGTNALLVKQGTPREEVLNLFR